MNFESYATMLWLDSDEVTQTYFYQLGKEAEGTREERQRELAKAIQKYIENNQPKLQPGLYLDLLEAATEQIDFEEVAGSFLDDDLDDEEATE